MASDPAATGARGTHSDEDAVLAEYAHRGERVVATLRLLTWLALGIASAGVGGATNERSEPSTLRGAVIFGWFLFAVATWFVLRRARFDPARARSWPFFLMAVDYTVLTFLQIHTNRVVRPEVGAAVIAIVLSYSVARFNGLQVWGACALACASIVIQALATDWFNARSVAMIISSYLALSAMIWWANRTIRRSFVEVRRRQQLSRFLPAQVVQRVLAQGEAALAPTQREVTILFSDLRDFTTMSERLEPGAVLQLLDEYFARMTAIVKQTGGMVNKFIGDGMLAVWGVPEAQPDHAERAVRAALEMRAEMERLNTLRASRSEPPLRIGIGIHTGVVAAGMLGGTDQAEYTVLGDAVNLASRIEGLCKPLATDLVVSEATLKLCPPNAFVTEPAGAENVKGRAAAVTVHRVQSVQSVK